MKLIFNISIIITGFFLMISCSKESVSKESKIIVDTEDAVIQQILNIRSKKNLEGKSNTEALKTFLTVDNPNHRYMAALALASIQDTSTILALADALRDPNYEVRKAVAFALGQTKSSLAAQYLAEAFREDSIQSVQAAILEAVGRCGTEKELAFLCMTQPYPIQDSLLQEGLALALYRFALRRMVQPEGSSRIIKDIISNAFMPPTARFVAANYLTRVPGLDLSPFETIINSSVKGEKDIDMLIFLTPVLAKTKGQDAFKTLKNIFYEKEDYRLRCQVVRGLQYFSYDSSKSIIEKALYDTSIHVQVCAAEYLIQNGASKDAVSYFEWSEKHPHWLIRAKLMAAAMNNTEYYKTQSKAFYTTKLTERFRKSENLYEKSEILQSLSYFSWNYKFLSDAIFPKSDSAFLSPILKSAAAQALVSLYESPLLQKEMNFSTARVREEIHQTFRKAIENRDPAVIAIISDAIANKKNNLKAAFPDSKFLKEAQSKLKLPRDYETYIYLQKAIEYISGGKTQNPPNTFVEIDWHFINALGPSPRVSLQTDRGQIILELFPKETPATVMQFVHLVKAGYYNNKVFHRAVPNFVVQGGCPRGDGWGGFDINVVSEFSSRRYTEAGLVGMASAGKDTESVQFFITTSPAIHLDGNYTIFARVVEGLEKVHQLEIGDKILKAELLGN